MTTTTTSHAQAALDALTWFLEKNPQLARTVCDTPGCPASFPGTAFEAVNAGWRHDLTRLFRCPDCTAKGWPDMLKATVKIPATLYKAWAAGDTGKLTTWLDSKFGPLATACDAGDSAGAGE